MIFPEEIPSQIIISLMQFCLLTFFWTFFLRRHPFNSLCRYDVLKQTYQYSITAAVYIANLNSNLRNIQVREIQNDLKFCDR